MGSPAVVSDDQIQFYRVLVDPRRIKLPILHQYPDGTGSRTCCGSGGNGLSSHMRNPVFGRLVVKFYPLLAAAVGLAALTPAAVSAAVFVKYTDRAAFTAAAGTVETETFNSITSDIDLATGHDFGGFTMKNQRVGAYGFSLVDATPFTSGQGSLNGSTYVQATTYNLSANFFSSLVITFDEGITAFGANFTSGAVGNVQLFVDGQLFEGYVEQQGGFFGFISDVAVSTIELRARAGSGVPYTFDDLTFSTSAVPEPASWAMMIGGLAMVGGALRRRSRLALA